MGFQKTRHETVQKIEHGRDNHAPESPLQVVHAQRENRRGTSRQQITKRQDIGYRKQFYFHLFHLKSVKVYRKYGENGRFIPGYREPIFPIAFILDGL